jgi:hypothetical protein
MDLAQYLADVFFKLVPHVHTVLFPQISFIWDKGIYVHNPYLGSMDSHMAFSFQGSYCTREHAIRAALCQYSSPLGINRGRIHLLSSEFFFGQKIAKRLHIIDPCDKEVGVKFEWNRQVFLAPCDSIVTI